MSCLIIGDSIAYGTSQVRKDCRSYTQVGISTIGWSKKWLKSVDYVADTVFISLGSNDLYRHFEEVADALYEIRGQIGYGKNVIWVLPAIKPWVQDLIWEVAYEYGDNVIELKQLSPDRVHPTYNGYRALGAAIK